MGDATFGSTEHGVIVSLYFFMPSRLGSMPPDAAYSYLRFCYSTEVRVLVSPSAKAGTGRGFDFLNGIVKLAVGWVA